MFHPKMKYTYFGIDPHKETHTAVAINCFYEKVGEITLKNIPSEFTSFLKSVKKLTVDGTEAVFALEDTSSYGRSLTVFLKNHKYIVKHVNSYVVQSERKSFKPSGKTDSADAECAARVLLNRFDDLNNANPDDKYWVLKNIVIRRTLIVKLNASLKKHVQSYILSHYPNYNKFFLTFDCKSSLAFYEKYPSPSKLEGVTEEELQDFFIEVTNNHSKKHIASKILNYVKNDGDTNTEYQEIRNMAIESSIRQIKYNLKELDYIDGILEELMDQFEYKLTTMKGVDTVTAADIIAEVGNIERFPNPESLASFAGISPYVHSSGKSELRCANKYGNRTLNTILFRMSLSLTTPNAKSKTLMNPIFYDYYIKKVSEGKTQRQALKCVQRRLVNIIWGLMKNKNEYINPPVRKVSA